MLKNKFFNHIIGSLALILILLSVVYCKQSHLFAKETANQTPSIYIVNLTENGFEPKEITIIKGSSIRFITNRKEPFWPASDPHPTHTIYSQFDPLKEIPETQGWTFQFNNIGRWRYHDHLFPNYTGIVNVVDNGSVSLPVVNLNIDKCSKVPDISGKQQCWDELLQTTVDTKGLDPAFKLFVELYNTEPDVPKGCHGWSHILGKAAYDQYKNNKNFILKPETSYCGYGFFHGFIEQLLQDTGNVKKTKEFCDFASKQLGDKAPGTYINCIHGIGHGSVNIDNPKYWGNFQAMIDPGLKICGSVDLNASELNTCYEGAFNAMEQNVIRQEYNLTFDKKDPFSYCRVQQEKYKEACYYEFAGVLAEVSGHNFKIASDLVSKENMSEDASNLTIRKLAADFMQDDIANKSQDRNVLDCRVIAEKNRNYCFQGVVMGFISHGEPGKEYVKGLEFCKNPTLTSYEKDTCYNIILGQLVRKDSEICNSVDVKYQKYCNN